MQQINQGQLVQSIKQSFLKGVAFGAGILATSLFAAAAAMNVFSSGQTISASQINQNFAISAPEGAIMAFNLASCPDGWAPADGSNGTPDMRGKFVRGRNDIGTGSPASAPERDPDARTLGSFQGDAFQGHYHNRNAGGLSEYVTTANAGGFGFQLTASSELITRATVSDPVSDGTNGNPRTAGETRPLNIALTYCMRKN